MEHILRDGGDTLFVIEHHERDPESWARGLWVGMTSDLVTKIRRGAYSNGDRPRHPQEPVLPDFWQSHRLSPRGLVEDYEVDLECYFAKLEVWRTQMKAWNQRAAELRVQFDADLLVEYGIADHPRAQTLLALAWARGGRQGLEQVYEEARPLALLLKP